MTRAEILISPEPLFEKKSSMLASYQLRKPPKICENPLCLVFEVIVPPDRLFRDVECVAIPAAEDLLYAWFNPD